MHHSVRPKFFLQFFLSHSSFRTSSSFVERGTAFEFRTLETLNALGFALRRVGGSDDRGVDLRGSLSLAGQDISTSVIIQCKHETKDLGPKYIRELEGALSRESRGTIGILVSNLGFTQKSLNLIQGSQQPLAFGIVDANCGYLSHFGLNRIAQQQLPGLVCTLTSAGIQFFQSGTRSGLS